MDYLNTAVFNYSTTDRKCANGLKRKKIVKMFLRIVHLVRLQRHYKHVYFTQKSKAIYVQFVEQWWPEEPIVILVAQTPKAQENFLVPRLSI